MASVTHAEHPEVDEGWLRSVLFSRDLESWIDLAPDPRRRVPNSQVYSETVSTAYQLWRWLVAQDGRDMDAAPAGSTHPASTAALNVSTWDGLLAVLCTHSRAQALQLRQLIDAGDATTRRLLARGYHDALGHAAYAYREVCRAPDVDREEFQRQLDLVVPATLQWLRETDAATGRSVADQWARQVGVLLGDLGFRLEL
jgi:hypothetical protein